MNLRYYIINLKRIPSRQIAHRFRKVFLARVPVSAQSRFFQPKSLRVQPEQRVWFMQPEGGWATPFCHPAVLESAGTQFVLFGGSVTEGFPSNSESWDPFCWYAFHSFDFMTELLDQYLVNKNEELLNICARILERWLDDYDKGIELAWDPHPMAKRITNWIRIVDSVGSQFPERLRNRILRSLIKQLGVLAHNLEFDLEGNHLVSEAKALLIAGCYLANSVKQATKWKKLGHGVLEATAKKQALADGGHYERSPMYHLVVLWDLLEAYGLSTRTGVTWSATFRNTLGRMLEFTQACVTPEGKVPNFNDSFEHYITVSLPETLLAGQLLLSGCGDTSGVYTPKVSWVTGVDAGACGSPNKANPHPGGRLCFPQTGYFGYRSASDFALWDAGLPGPLENPGHGHADPLHFIWYANGKPILVDSGVNTYHNAEWRTYFRGTGAHNCVRIDGADAAEVWGRFRFGRIYHAQCEESTLMEIAGRQAFYFRGYHDGFTRLPDPVKVWRESWFVPGICLVVRDRLVGRSEHRFESRFHFHPKVEVTPTDRATRLTARSEGLTLEAEVLYPAAGIVGNVLTAAADGGWYAPRYNALEPTTTWSIAGRFDGSLTIAVAFFYSSVTNREAWLKAINEGC